MVGQGMNSVELGANPTLHQHFVQVKAMALPGLLGNYESG